MEAARITLLDAMTKSLAAGYRLNTKAWNEPQGQLILPSQLTLLPLVCMDRLKTPMLRSSSLSARSALNADLANPTADERAYA